MDKVVFSNEKLISGVKTIAKAVKATLGPEGELVLVTGPNLINGRRFTKDGVTVAKNVSSEDKVEDLAIKTVLEASLKTAEEAGDGTSNTVVLTEALIDNALANINESDNKNDIIRGIRDVAKVIDARLVKMAKKATGKRLENVAFISSNGNKEVSKTVADLYKTSDRVILETSKTGETYTNSVSGLVVDRGFTSKYFVNNLKTNECVMENAVILFTDSEINKIQTIEHVIKHVIENDKPLLIVGELSFEVLGTLNLNVQQGRIKVANIIPPRSNYQKEVMMTDLAKMTGGVFYSESAGDNLLNVTADGLGEASKIIIGKDKTIIVPKSDNKEYLESVKSSSDDNAKFLEDRINAISGNMNTVFVGAATDAEKNELYDIYEDVILACKSAIEQGVIPGAGVSFKDAVKELGDSKAEKIVKDSLLTPYKIFSTGKPVDWTVGLGYNVRTKELCDVAKDGILDPLKVGREVLKNAVSVATTIINTNTVVL